MVSLVSGACQRQKIETYRIPKATLADTLPSMAMGQASPHASPRGEKNIAWKVPSGWEEQTPSSMRVGSFLIKGPNGQQADVSVVPLSGDAGGDLANINRWRGQIGLGPIPESDLGKESESIAPAGRKMLLTDFANENKRLVAAIYHQENRSWFFKMTGDEAAVGSAKPAFLQFLESLTFHEN